MGGPSRTAGAAAAEELGDLIKGLIQPAALSVPKPRPYAILTTLTQTHYIPVKTHEWHVA